MPSLLDFLRDPRIFGSGLALGGSLLDKEPGEVLEARQALRNQFTAPPSALVPSFSQPGLNFLTQQVTGPSDPFAAGGVYESYLPVLKRQEEDILSGLQTRYSAAFPAIAGIQGPEVEALRRATGELTQNRQALIANLLREQQTRQTQSAGALLDYGRTIPDVQQRAARSVLEFSRPDPFAESLAKLGTVLALSGTGGGGFGTGGGAGASAIDSILKSIFGGAPGGTGGSAGGGLGAGGLGAVLATQIPGLGISVGTLLGALGAGTAGTLGGGALGRSLFGETDESRGASGLGGGLGSLLGAILGTFVAPGVGTIAGAGLGGGAGGLAGAGVKQPDISRRETFQGALGGGLFGGLGSFFAGQGNQSTGKNLRDAGVTALATLAFGPAGGAIAGGVLGKQRGARIEKAQFRSQDVDSQRDQVFEEGNIGASLLQQAGVSQADMDGFQGFVESAAARSEGPGDEQGEVAAELNRLLTSAGYPSGQRPAAWRQQWIEYLTRSTFTSGNSSYGGGAPLNFIEGPWARAAGL